MKIKVPVHQFEIRYSRILNFSQVIKGVLAPFVPLAIDVQIEQENSTIAAKYSLVFDRYNIITTWDRIILRFEGNIDNLSEKNSIMEEPFFHIFDNIKKLDDFGAVKNYLCFSLVVNTFDAQKNITDNFIKKHFNSSITKILPEHTDVAITLEDKTSNKQTLINFGPYNGFEDLNLRNSMPKSPEMQEGLDIPGEMAEIKLFEVNKSISFSTYREALKSTKQIIERLWEK